MTTAAQRNLWTHLLTFALAATGVAGGTIVAAAPANASGCVGITKVEDITTGGMTNKRYTVRNYCYRTVSATLDVAWEFDPPCKSIASRSSTTFTSYGHVRDAKQC